MGVTPLSGDQEPSNQSIIILRSGLRDVKQPVLCRFLRIAEGVRLLRVGARYRGKRGKSSFRAQSPQLSCGKRSRVGIDAERQVLLQCRRFGRSRGCTEAYGL